VQHVPVQRYFILVKRSKSPITSLVSFANSPTSSATRVLFHKNVLIASKKIIRSLSNFDPYFQVVINTRWYLKIITSRIIWRRIQYKNWIWITLDDFPLIDTNNFQNYGRVRWVFLLRSILLPLSPLKELNCGRIRGIIRGDKTILELSSPLSPIDFGVN